jgi:hypothetical protein
MGVVRRTYDFFFFLLFFFLDNIVHLKKHEILKNSPLPCLC